MSSFNCTACNVPNASNARFCTNCGASLAIEKTSPYQSPESSSNRALVSEFAFAGFWKRFIAYVIDGILFTLLFVLFIYFLGGSAFSTNPNEVEDIYAAIGVYVLYYPSWWLYFAVMESSNFQGTLGKKIMGIKVTNRFGQPIGFGQATARHFSALLTQLTFTIGYLMTAFTARKQALHDMVAGTLVVNQRYDATQIKVASESPGSGMSIGSIITIIFLVLLIPVGGIIAAVAIPAYQDYTVRAHIQQAITDTRSIQTTIENYATDTGYWPNTLEKAGISQTEFDNENYHLLLSTDGVYQIIFKQPDTLSQSRISFRPELNSQGSYNWICESIDINVAQLPSRCR
ncbi:MAG: RDD family protein [Kangiellaceae bacterium]|nr:RDD family protein [Kangiellaceae bacterium]